MARATTLCVVLESEIVIVGAGVIGLATAFELATAGHSVTLVDPFPGRGASFVAAGMLAPVTEALYQEPGLAAFSMAASAQWEIFARQLGSATALALGYERTGTIYVAGDRNDRTLLQAQLPLYRELDDRTQWFDHEELREMEPLLAPQVRGGIYAPHDYQVDNRRLLSALSDALGSLRVQIRRERVERVVLDASGVTGIITERLQIASTTVVIAAGVHSGSISDLPVLDRPTLRPVKGQILRLFQRDPALRPSKTVRALVGGRPVYCVPRADGQIVIGATVEERSEVTRATAGGIHQLLDDALTVLPSLSEAELLGAEVGFRPATMDHAPFIGPSATTGLLYATGHFRHGVLFAPLTAQAIREYIDQGSLPSVVEPFRPRERHRVLD